MDRYSISFPLTAGEICARSREMKSKKYKGRGGEDPHGHMSGQRRRSFTHKNLFSNRVLTLPPNKLSLKLN